jgi:chromate transporter
LVKVQKMYKINVMQVTLFDLFLSFLKLGLTAFGGPAMVAYIRELAVQKKGWLDQRTFNEGVALAQIVPGPIAMHVAGFVGVKLRGIVGAITTYVAFALPAFLLMLFLSALYQKTSNLPQVISLFNGLKVIVVAIVANAFLSFTKSIVKSKVEFLIALASFILLLMGISPFFVLILCFFFSQVTFKDKTQSLETSATHSVSLLGIVFLLISLLLWLIVLYFLNADLFKLSLVMVKINLFAFGGAYTALPLMLHEVVENMKLLDSKTFMDGIALGQVTPGPILITATFVGYLVYGLSGAILATIYVFTPSFILYLLSIKIADRIRNNPIFLKGKRGILSSFCALLLFASFKLSFTIDWNIIKLFFFIASLLVLYKGINILYVVIFGGLLSFILFR